MKTFSYPDELFIMYYPDMYDNLKGILVYVLNGKEFCCDLHSVINIIKTEEILQSNMIIDGKSILFSSAEYQIIDFNKAFGMEHLEFNEFSRAILFEEYSKKVSFFVDEIVEIITIENIMIDDSVKFEPSSHKYWKYYLKHSRKTIIWPNYEKLIKDKGQFKGISLKTFKTILG